MHSSTHKAKVELFGTQTNNTVKGNTFDKDVWDCWISLYISEVSVLELLV